MFGVIQHLDVVLCKDAQEAIDRGFQYRLPEYKAVQIEQVVVVQNGTEGGNSTVDLVMKDEAGNKFVVMITGNLLKSIPC